MSDTDKQPTDTEYLEDETKQWQTFEGRHQAINKKMFQLQEQKIKAEINYYYSKTAFLKTEIDNVKTERSLLVLQAKQLKVEIEILQSDV